MITDPHPNPALNCFKPPLYILHKALVVQIHPSAFQKRYYKNVHHLTLKPKTKSFIKKMPMPKTLRSVHLDSVVFNTWSPGQNLPIVKKLVKPYRKYLRDIKGGADHPKIKKLLPFLASLNVNLTKEAFRMLTFHSNVKNLHFEMPVGLTIRIKREADELLVKYKTQVSRSLANMKGLTAVLMSISQEMQAANFMLEIIEKNVSLDSVKEFSLHFSSHPNPADFQKSLVSKVRERLTHLSAENLAWYSLFISSGSLANLSVLKLKLNSEGIDWDLLQFQNLPKLHKFILDFKADSPSSQIDFFQNITLPPSTEDFTLTLNGFTFSLTSENRAAYTQFFKRLQKAKRVKSLNLRINEKADNPSKTAKFACFFIKCFDHLEVLHFTNLKAASYGSNIKPEPLDFQEFWTAVGNSKETLRNINVIVNEVNFPEKITALETEFPRLQKLYLGEGVSSAVELGRFCQKIPSLRDLTVKGAKLIDEGKLKIFLGDMEEIPKGGEFALHLDVGWMKQKPLISCLRKYIEIVEAKGRLGIVIKEVQVEDIQAFREILKLVVQKRCFEPFSMMTKNYRTLFFVSKTKIAQAVDGLALN